MANFNPLSSTVSFDDLLKANKQAFDQIFSAQTKELGLLGANHRMARFVSTACRLLRFSNLDEKIETENQAVLALARKRQRVS